VARAFYEDDASGLVNAALDAIARSAADKPQG
jgi:transcription termination factor NusB